MAGREEMGVNITNAPAPKTLVLDESEHFRLLRDGRGGKSVDPLQNHPALANIPERELADYEWVRRNLGLFKAFHKRGQASAEVVHPYRSVNEDHAPCVLRRGTGSSPGSLHRDGRAFVRFPVR